MFGLLSILGIHKPKQVPHSPETVRIQRYLRQDMNLPNASIVEHDNGEREIIGDIGTGYRVGDELARSLLLIRAELSEGLDVYTDREVVNV